jgi:hypothetical protein
VQALLHDHVECGKHTAADVVAKAQAILSESGLLMAMWKVGVLSGKHAAVDGMTVSQRLAAAAMLFRPLPFLRKHRNGFGQFHHILYSSQTKHPLGFFDRCRDIPRRMLFFDRGK